MILITHNSLYFPLSLSQLSSEKKKKKNSPKTRLSLHLHLPKLNPWIPSFPLNFPLFIGTPFSSFHFFRFLSFFSPFILPDFLLAGPYMLGFRGNVVESLPACYSIWLPILRLKVILLILFVFYCFLSSSLSASIFVISFY